VSALDDYSHWNNGDRGKLAIMAQHLVDFAFNCFNCDVVDVFFGSRTANNSEDKQIMAKANKVVYQEFGASDDDKNLDRETLDIPPKQQNLRIQASKTGRKGKTVTVIIGWQHSPEQLTQLLKQLKNLCGSGGTVKDSAIELQGDHKQKLQQFLTDLGYKAKISGG
jgi:translation initiation factor 1